MSKNEQGSVLLIVLLMMTVFSIIGITVMGMEANNAKQIAYTGSGIKATNLAEMGVAHMKRSTAAILAENKEASLSDTAKLLQTALPSGIAFPINKDSSYPLYKMEDVEILATNKEEQEVIKIVFTSIGIAEDYQERRINAELKIARGEGNGEFPEPDKGMEVSEEDEITSNGPFLTPILYDSHLTISSNHNPVFEKDIYFKNGLTARANTEVTFESSLYLKGESFIESNSNIVVYGDAYIENMDVKQNPSGKGNQGLLCVEGAVRLYGDIESTVTITSQSCETITSAKHYSGIYAKEVIKPSEESDTEEWEVNALKLEALYR